MNDFISLRKFACEALGKTFKPNSSDFEMQMNLGERYARVLSNYVNESFNIVDFSCNNNDIRQSMHCLTNEGSLDLSLHKNSITGKSHLEVVLNENGSKREYASTFSTFAEFSESLKNNLIKDVD